jgi:hypothetical protein
MSAAEAGAATPIATRPVAAPSNIFFMEFSSLDYRGGQARCVRAHFRAQSHSEEEDEYKSRLH